MTRHSALPALTAILAMLVAGPVWAQQTNPLFKEAKVRNYLPHMTWAEAEQALARTDVAIIPVGSIEQHGPHLPLGTDIYAAVQTCQLIAQRTDVLIAPAVFAGLSEHHMGFPGTIALSPETFEAVVYETAQSLIAHGVRKILIYNGHGGNTVSVQNVLNRINQETGATAVFLNTIPVPAPNPPEKEIPYDFHAGVGETSLMLYLTPALVDMSQARKPTLTFPPIAQKALAAGKADALEAVVNASLFRPKDTGKRASTREMTDTGVVTSGDPRDGTAESGRREVDRLVAAAVAYIETWKGLDR